MRVIVASDHAGYKLKCSVISHLKSLGLQVTDAGTQNPDTTVDYPDYAQIVSHAVAKGVYERGILICSTGQGMAIAANKVPGIRAALCHDIFTARRSRAHNDSNILCLGEWVVTSEEVIQILDEWFNIQFEGGIHAQRVAKLESHNNSSTPQISPRLQKRLYPYRFGIAISPTPTRFGPIVYAGRLNEGIQKATQEGFSNIELSLRSPGDIEIESLKSLLAEKQARIVALATGQACIEDNMCLSDTNSQVVYNTIQHLKEIIRIGAYFQASVIIGGIRGRLTGSGDKIAQQRARAIESLRECATYSHKHNVTLLIEPINRYETNFVNNAREGMQLIEEIGDSAIRLLLDTFHMNIEESDIFNSITSARDFLSYVHVADSNRLAPGQGHIDFNKLFETLSNIGYQGNITAEILPIPDDETAVINTARYLTSLIN